MDNITHTLTGLALSRAGLKRWCPQATAILLLAANAPDADVVSALGGATTYLHYHRHITHSLLAIPVMALVPVLIVRLFTRKPFRWRSAYLVSFVGAASHPMLDLMNVYGIRLLLPFSGAWFRLDLFNIVDLWIWSVLALAAAAPLLARLVSAEIGAKPGSGRGWALFALTFLVLYAGGRYFLHERALAVLDSRLYDGSAPRRVAAFPTAANPLRWNGLVETDPAYTIFDVNLLGEFDPSDGRAFYKPELGPRELAAGAAARRTEALRVFLDFSQFPSWRFLPAEKPEGATRVEVADLRFGSDPPRFVAWAIVDPNGAVIDSAFGFGPPRAR